MLSQEFKTMYEPWAYDQQKVTQATSRVWSQAVVTFGQKGWISPLVKGTLILLTAGLINVVNQSSDKNQFSVKKEKRGDI